MSEAIASESRLSPQNTRGLCYYIKYLNIEPGLFHEDHSDIKELLELEPSVR